MTLDLEVLTEIHIERFSSPVETAKADLELVLTQPEFKKAFAICDNGEVLGVIGGSLISSGVWEGWFYISNLAGKKAFSLVKTCKLFSDLVVEHDVHRLQIAVLPEFRKWAEALGFQFESVVKNYHRNIDHYMYVKVRGSDGR